MKKFALYFSLLFSVLLISSCTKNQYEEMIAHTHCGDTEMNSNRGSSDGNDSDGTDGADDNGSVANDGSTDSTGDTDENITDPNNDPDSRRKKKL
jgi:hypothetical protein